MVSLFSQRKPKVHKLLFSTAQLHFTTAQVVINSTLKYALETDVIKSLRKSRSVHGERQKSRHPVVFPCDGCSCNVHGTVFQPVSLQLLPWLLSKDKDISFH